MGWVRFTAVLTLMLVLRSTKHSFAKVYSIACSPKMLIAPYEVNEEPNMAFGNSARIFVTTPIATATHVFHALYALPAH